jgi:hypothetical protein
MSFERQSSIWHDKGSCQKGQLMGNRLAAVGLAAGLIGGGLAGLVVGITSSAGAATPTPTATTPTTATPAPATAGGTGSFKSNEDPTHEAGESAAREAEEDAGFGGHSNEDPAHEATESAAREAEEDARAGSQAPTSVPPATTAPTTVAPPA